ncbi:MAG: hypothetical protein NZ899_09570 [Thermoguttaceae bacterium]|nr:hypothetical protein [Thermoguttaceae bacterium]
MVELIFSVKRAVFIIWLDQRVKFGKPGNLAGECRGGPVGCDGALALILGGWNRELRRGFRGLWEGWPGGEAGLHGLGVPWWIICII